MMDPDLMLEKTKTPPDHRARGVEEYQILLATLHDAALDAFNWIGGAKPLISRDDLLANLRHAMADARKALE